MELIIKQTCINWEIKRPLSENIKTKKQAENLLEDVLNIIKNTDIKEFFPNIEIDKNNIKGEVIQDKNFTHVIIFKILKIFNPLINVWQGANIYNPYQIKYLKKINLKNNLKKIYIKAGQISFNKLLIMQNFGMGKINITEESKNINWIPSKNYS